MHEVEFAGSMLARETMKSCRRRSEHCSVRLGRPLLLADSGASPRFAFGDLPHRLIMSSRKPRACRTSSQETQPPPSIVSKIARCEVVNARFPCGTCSFQAREETVLDFKSAPKPQKKP